MIEIGLPCGRVTLISDVDAELARMGRWRADEHNASGKPYVKATIGGRTIYLHRLITKCPPQYKVDHDDRDTLNNQRRNLRIATHDQNNANRTGWALSGYKGVYRERSKCRARITINGEQRHLGTFADEKDAARAYDAASYAQFGEFAFLNFPEDYPKPFHDHPPIPFFD